VVRIYDEGSAGEWDKTSSQETYVAIDLNSALLPRTGTKRIKASIAVPDTVVASPQHFIGEKYQGGIIFYLDPASDGKKGLIAAEKDTAIDVFYSNLSGYTVYATGATGSAIGTGQANTALMIANEAARSNAVKYCDELIIEPYSDWYMPSEKELAALYLNRNKVANLGPKTYWSSTESAWDKARCISFSDGVAYTRNKNNRYCVRAVRYFDDTTLTNNKPVDTLTLSTTRVAFSSSAPVAVKNGVLAMFIKSSLPWRPNTVLLVESYLAGVKTGNAVISPSTNMFGFKSESPDWQLVAIQMANFNPSQDTLDGFRINMVGSWPNNIDFGIDVVRYQFSTLEIKKQVTYETGVRFVESPDGSRTLFSLPKAYKVGSTQVYAMGVRLCPGVDYTESGGKIQFVEAPESGDILTCDYYTL
jgi:hypothetical protein